MDYFGCFLIALSVFSLGSVFLVTNLELLSPSPTKLELPYGNGKIDKLEYVGHSYIGWSRGGLVHDPDCKCKNKE